MAQDLVRCYEGDLLTCSSLTLETGSREKCSGVLQFLWPKHVFRNEIHGH